VRILAAIALLASCGGPDDQLLATLDSQELSDLCTYQYMVEGIAPDGSRPYTCNGTAGSAMFPTEACCASTVPVSSCRATIADAKKCYRDIAADICALFDHMPPASCAILDGCYPVGGCGGF
jgi:hypothetical protein